MLHHRGYSGRIERERETGQFHGEVLGTHGLITFQGQTAEDAEAAFRDAIDDYLAFWAERGEVPEEPPAEDSSAETLVLHVPQALHQTLASRARHEGKSVSEFVVDWLSQSARPGG